jgi:2-polyprenyl-3-methyl-5-hydroxy-6-metoxy-1,4-benzoquinol methylase
MFAMREPARPTEASSKAVGQVAAEILPFFKDVHHINDYVEAHGTRIAFDVDYADRFLKPNDRVLEIGAFPYVLTLPLVNRGYNLTALDKCKSLQYIPSIADKFKLKVLDCDLDTDPIPEADSSFDSVIMNEVFEHLRVNLIASMREIHRVLRPGGLLLLSTPNLRSVRGIYNLLRREEAYCSMGGVYDNFAYLEQLGVMGHVREYTPKEVRDFLQKMGFEIEGTIYRGEYVGGWFWRLSQLFTFACPQFKPFFSIVARKPNAS